MEFQVDEDSGVDGDDGVEDIVIPSVIIDYGATSLDDYNDWPVILFYFTELDGWFRFNFHDIFMFFLIVQVKL